MDKIITKRPDDMEYKEYRQVRKLQTRQLRQRKKHGELVWSEGTYIKEIHEEI